jgi:hypothetical protein
MATSEVAKLLIETRMAPSFVSHELLDRLVSGVGLSHSQMQFVREPHRRMRWIIKKPSSRGMPT